MIEVNVYKLHGKDAVETKTFEQSQKGLDAANEHADSRLLNLYGGQIMNKGETADSLIGIYRTPFATKTDSNGTVSYLGYARISKSDIKF